MLIYIILDIKKHTAFYAYLQMRIVINRKAIKYIVVIFQLEHTKTNQKIRGIFKATDI